MIPERVAERFWTRVDQNGPDECWPWLMSVGNHGYGQIGWSEGGRTHMVLAHRVAWFLTVGPIPEGLTIDHLCRVRRCCNPAHLQLLTNSENGRANGNSIKTHCPAGHPYDEANTYRPERGGRMCKACRPAPKTDRGSPGTRTHCPQGHEYTAENTYIGRRRNGSTFRTCRACALARNRRP